MTPRPQHPTVKSWGVKGDKRKPIGLHPVYVIILCCYYYIWVTPMTMSKIQSTLTRSHLGFMCKGCSMYFPKAITTKKQKFP